MLALYEGPVTGDTIELRIQPWSHKTPVLYHES